MEQGFKRLEELVIECGGMYGFTHSKRIIELVRQVSEGKAYNEEIIEFCALTHDLGAYSKYAVSGVDHAVRSLEIVPALIKDYNFSNEEQELIYEVIGNHHGAAPGKSFESILFRDADALDFIGYIGITRDIARAGKDVAKGFDSIKKHRQKLPGMLVLESSQRIAKTRVEEMDQFINNFSFEAFGYI